MTPIKIFELKGNDWMKGLSIQSGLALGGLFSTAINFDPFEKMGYLKPSLAPVQIDGTTITTQVNLLCSAYAGSGTDGYVFALGNRAGTGTKCLYRIKMSDSSVTDLSASIDGGAPTGAVIHNSLYYWKNRVIYSQGGSLRSITTAGTGDIEILSGAATYNGIPKYTGFVVGPDQNLYYTPANYSIGKIVTADNTTSNTTTAFTFTDHYLEPTDITCDGTYLIFTADNNQYKSTLFNANCKIFFWDSLSSKASVIYDIPESYIISCRYVNGKVLMLGTKGLWACNIDTPPRLIFPMTSSMLPSHPNQVCVKDNIMYWTSTALGGKVYAYGSKIGDNILFNPFLTNGSDNLNTGICAVNNYLFASTDAGTNDAKVWLLNSGSTRSSASIETTNTILSQPYSLSYIKVVLDAPLSAGQEVLVGLYNGNGGVIKDTETKVYATEGAKQTLIFNPKTTAGYFSQFEELYISLSSVGATIQRVVVYGTPIDDFNQKI